MPLLPIALKFCFDALHKIEQKNFWNRWLLQMFASSAPTSNTSQVRCSKKLLKLLENNGGYASPT